MTNGRSHNFKDLTGSKFGKWTVIKYVETAKRRQTFWECKCECGNSKVVSSNSLRNGSKSCGCIKKAYACKHLRKDPHSVVFGNLLARYKNDAIRRGLNFDLTKEEFIELTKQNCYYCDIEPKFKLDYHEEQTFFYNGVDRVDNDLGYVNTNCVPCCKECNSKKKATNKVMIIRAYNFLMKIEN